MTKQERLRQVFGSSFGATQRTAEPAAEPAAYRKIKRRLEKLNTADTPIEMLREWTAAEKPVVLFSVPNQLEEEYRAQLDAILVPYLAKRGIWNTSFVIRKDDEIRTSKACDDLEARLSSAPRLFNFPDFLSELNNARSIYLKYLTEEEEESIVRHLCSYGNGTKCGVFRMGANRWGIGIYAWDMLADTVHAAENPCLMKSCLYTAFALNGPQKQAYLQHLESDFCVDRMASINFWVSLQGQKQIFIYDPAAPYRGMTVREGQFTRYSVRRQDGTIRIHCGKWEEMDFRKNRYRYRQELLRMNHKKIAYTDSELLDAVVEWKSGQAETEHEYLEAQDAIRHMTDLLYEHFSDMRQEEEWFDDPSKAMVQADKFRADIEQMTDYLAMGMVPQFFSKKKAQQLMHYIRRSGFTEKNFRSAWKWLDELTVDSIGEHNIDRFRDQIRTRGGKAPASDEIRIESQLIR